MPIVADAAVAIRGDLSKFSSDLDKAETQTKTLGGKLKNALSPGNLAAGLAGGFAVSQIGQFLGDAIQSAGVFEDTVSATSVIFSKEFTPALEEWAEEAHSAFGASKQDALDAANQIAVFGKSAGLAGDDLVGFSTEMVQLGGDLASMFGGSTQEAITAVGAALRGESEPIRRYGVLLDDATLRAKAFEMGIIDTITKALTPQQRVLAAQAEIMAQTSDAQGDFARTSDGLMNTQRDLAAEMENLQIEIGEELLPIMVDVMHAFRDFVPHIKDAIPVVVKLTGAALELAKLAIPILVVAVGRNLVGAFNKAKVAGMGLGGALAVIAAGALVYKDELLSAAAAGIKHEIGLKRGAAAAEAFGDAYAESGGDIGKALEAVEAFTDSMQGAAAATAGAMGKMAGHIKDAEPVIAAAVDSGVTDPMQKALREAREKAAEEVRAIPAELAAALIEGRDEVVIAAALLAKAGTDPLIEKAKLLEIREHMKELSHITLEEREKATPATIAADQAMYAALEIELAGHLLRQDPKSKEAAQLLAKYATSEEPATMAAYDGLMSEIEQRAYIMANDIEGEAERAGISPEEAFKRHKEAAAEQALGLARGLIKALDMESDAGVAGTGAVNAWVDAMIAAFGKNVPRTAAAVGAYSKMLRMAGSPDYTHAIEAGVGVGKAWVGGIVDALHSGLGDVTAALPTLSANGGLPSMTSMALGATSAVASGSTIGDTIVHINAPTVPMTERDIGRELRRTGVFGGTP